MIFYNPIDGDVQAVKVEYRPRTCFIITKLGRPVPRIVTNIRSRIQDILIGRNIQVIDADSVVTGRDFLLKIWRLILGVPLGIAIIDKAMTSQTFSNIFYELGMMQAYGKETVIVKTSGTKVPSDFVRTEYIEYNHKFEARLDKFIDSYFRVADHFETMADNLQRNPLLSIDYLRRAYLITGNPNLRAKNIFNESGFEARAKNSVEMVLVDF